MTTKHTYQLNNEEALRFILAGNSTVTVKNTNTGNRITYRISKPTKTSPHFVGVLFHNGTNHIYKYIGCIFDRKTFVVGKKSKLKRSSMQVRGFMYVFNKLLQKSLPDIVEIWHEGMCGKCGRMLTVPESIRSGYGPHCLKQINK